MKTRYASTTDAVLIDSLHTAAIMSSSSMMESREVTAMIYELDAYRHAMFSTQSMLHTTVVLKGGPPTTGWTTRMFSRCGRISSKGCTDNLCAHSAIFLLMLLAALGATLNL
jgi:hypothetical protein